MPITAHIPTILSMVTRTAGQPLMKLADKMIKPKPQSSSDTLMYMLIVFFFIPLVATQSLT